MSWSFPTSPGARLLLGASVVLVLAEAWFRYSDLGLEYLLQGVSQEYEYAAVRRTFVSGLMLGCVGTTLVSLVRGQRLLTLQLLGVLALAVSVGLDVYHRLGVTYTYGLLNEAGELRTWQADLALAGGAFLAGVVLATAVIRYGFKARRSHSSP